MCVQRRRCSARVPPLTELQSPSTSPVEQTKKRRSRDKHQPARGLGSCDSKSMEAARRDVGRRPRNAVDGIGGRRLPPRVVAPANNAARTRLDRAPVQFAHRDVGRGPRDTIDGVRDRDFTPSDNGSARRGVIRSSGQS